MLPGYYTSKHKDIILFRSRIQSLPPIPLRAVAPRGLHLSALFLLLGLAAVSVHGGLRYGVDFSGGVAVQLQFAKPVDDEMPSKTRWAILITPA